MSTQSAAPPLCPSGHVNTPPAAPADRLILGLLSTCRAPAALTREASASNGRRWGWRCNPCKNWGSPPARKAQGVRAELFAKGFVLAF